MEKSPQAFRTISEVAQWLETPAHVLRFWESRFPEIAPVKRAGGRRYYRPEDMRLLGGIKHLLHSEGHTIKSVQDRLKSEGPGAVSAFSQPLAQEERQNGAAAPNVPGSASPDAAMLADVSLDDEPPARRKPAEEDELPPIGFFFDDSEDALPAKDQSGTFAPDLLDAAMPGQQGGEEDATAAPQAPEDAPQHRPDDAASAGPKAEAPAKNAAQPPPDAAGTDEASDGAGPSAAMRALDELPPDPDEDAPLAVDSAAPLPMAWELRALDPGALRPDDRHTLRAAAERLQALRNRTDSAD